MARVRGPAAAAHLRKKMAERGATTLNVAGPRAAEEPGVYAYVQAVMSAAFDDERPRRRRAPDPPPEPPLVWKNDRPKRSKTARRRARRLERLPDIIRSQANKF